MPVVQDANVDPAASRMYNPLPTPLTPADSTKSSPSVFKDLGSVDSDPPLPPTKRRRTGEYNGADIAAQLDDNTAEKNHADGSSQATRLDIHIRTPSGTATSSSASFPRENSASPSTAAPIAGAETNATTQERPVAPPIDYEKYKPKSSIPAIPATVYAQECINAAYASRLNPYALHRDEQEALQDHLCHLHVTTYLNIRNGILRLWTRNPMVSVTKEEALGCAKDYRWMGLASFAYEWLVRNGYINFGCVEVPKAVLTPPKRAHRNERPVIVIVGAGVSGLGCARQLESLFKQYKDDSITSKVIILEGRRRIGGRVYSHPLHSHENVSLPKGLRPTADMGAQIVVGFDGGNPLDPIIRAQLALHCHMLRDISTIYDIDGSAVDELQDARDERLYNDLLGRSGLYRHKAVITPTAEGNRELIDHGRDVVADDGVTVKQYEEARAAGTVGMLLPAARFRRGIGHKTARHGPPPTAPVPDTGPDEELPAAMECQRMGWTLREGVSPNETLDLDGIAKQSPTQTLGAVMDEGVRQYQKMLPLEPKDMRLLNWHYANLEYANATTLGTLSLSGWDQDMGNEFEGEHAQVIGGYQQLPRGLWALPTRLDVRPTKTVTKISYDERGQGRTKAVVYCEDGEAIEADHVVYTGSLGTLKRRTVEFNPPLPEWKLEAIDRLGFGVMNKVVLVFDKPFWDVNRDMFGLLREPTGSVDSMNQADYATNRGRFYLFWNCVKTSGMPVLIALMAGHAAHQAETMTDGAIVTEVTAQLRKIFSSSSVTVPDPLETIVTRWQSDKFTYGSYSFVAAEALPGDYDVMAQAVGNLHFAGEATCGTHPATVHGAYLSGLRAAREIIDAIYGPIAMPSPLVPSKPPSPAINTVTSETRSSSSSTAAASHSAYTAALTAHIHATLGPAPARPARLALNPFLSFQKDYWQAAREEGDGRKRAATNNPHARAARDEIRAILGRMWREAAEDVKAPYHAQMQERREENERRLEEWRQEMEQYKRRVAEEKERWIRENPFEEWRRRR